jgi:hypothetical protein
MAQILPARVGGGGLLEGCNLTRSNPEQLKVIWVFPMTILLLSPS